MQNFGKIHDVMWATGIDSDIQVSSVASSRRMFRRSCFQFRFMLKSINRRIEESISDFLPTPHQVTQQAPRKVFVSSRKRLSLAILVNTWYCAKHLRNRAFSHLEQNAVWKVRPAFSLLAKTGAEEKERAEQHEKTSAV